MKERNPPFNWPPVGLCGFAPKMMFSISYHFACLSHHHAYPFLVSVFGRMYIKAAKDT